MANAVSSIGHLLQRTDRIAMARYELTGDFGVGLRPDCGNLPWFNRPHGTPPPGRSETLFGTISPGVLLDAKSAAPSRSLAEMAEQLILADSERLGRVSVVLRCSRFEDAIGYIAAQRPWTMSWSNVLDYIEAGEFHRLARACSVHGDTVHYGCSMNWPSNVAGASILDYASIL